MEHILFHVIFLKCLDKAVVSCTDVTVTGFLSQEINRLNEENTKLRDRMKILEGKVRLTHN